MNFYFFSFCIYYFFDRWVNQTLNVFISVFQMVWEQGSVVIVMLSKLTENGEAMCHRYWPEEGSDLYHIYEVCLKNGYIKWQKIISNML